MLGSIVKPRQQMDMVRLWLLLLLWASPGQLDNGTNGERVGGCAGHLIDVDVKTVWHVAAHKTQRS